MGRKRRFREITRTQGYWIKFKMAINGITQYDIAVQAGCSPQMVSQVITGVKNSERVGKALAGLLGYATFDDLMAIASRASKEGAA